MSSIHSKLNLYAGGGLLRSGNSGSEKEDAKAAPAETSLQFGSLSLVGMAPDVYCVMRKEDTTSFGNVRLERYSPFHLSGILQLALLNDFEAVHPEDLLFLDTETTGLNRGAGVLPFLTGLAYFQNGVPVVEQLFLNDFAGEEAYLERIVDRIGSFPYLVTYNGKSFDIPLLRNRLILNRKRGVGVGIHFDLLHIFRRLAPRGGVPGHRQGDLESFFLGHERVDDLAGSQVPQIYFDYKKYGESSGMERVLEHNRLDMLGMVYLFLEAVRIYEQKDVSRGSLRSGIARILNNNRRRPEAMEMLEGLLHEVDEKSGDSHAVPQEGGEIHSHLRYRDLLLLASLYRVEGRFAKSAEIYKHIIEIYDCPYARLSLAKIAEHRLKDYGVAMEQTDHLLGMAQAQEEHSRSGKKRVTGAHSGAGSNGKGIIFIEELQRRRERLKRKNEKVQKCDATALGDPL